MNERLTKVHDQEKNLLHAIDPLRVVVTSIFGDQNFTISAHSSPLRLESHVSGQRFPYSTSDLYCSLGCGTAADLNV